MVDGQIGVRGLPAVRLVDQVTNTVPDPAPTRDQSSEDVRALDSLARSVAVQAIRFVTHRVVRASYLQL